MPDAENNAHSPSAHSCSLFPFAVEYKGLLWGQLSISICTRAVGGEYNQGRGLLPSQHLTVLSS